MDAGMTHKIFTTVALVLLFQLSKGSVSDLALARIDEFQCPAGSLAIAVPLPVGCGSTLTVSCLTGSNVLLTGPAYFVDLPRPIEVGDTIVTTATPPSNTVWEISLMSGDEIDIYLTGRFNHLGDVNKLIWNSFVGGVWGSEGNGGANFPFTVGTEFTMTIDVQPSGYQILFDGVEMTTFSFPSSAPVANKLRFWGDIAVRTVVLG